MTITSAGGRQRQRVPEASLSGMSSQSVRTPVWDPTSKEQPETGEERKRKIVLY